MQFFKGEVPKQARVFIVLVVSLGAMVLVYSLVEAFTATDLRWLFLALVAVATGLFSVRLPFVREKVQSLTVTVSDLFIFAAILLYSPEVAVIVSWLDGIAASSRVYRRKSLYRIFFNFAQLSLSTFLVGHLFYRLMGTAPPLDAGQLDDIVTLFLNLAICALLHFALNAGLVSVAVALMTGKRALRIVTENLLWASWTTIAGAAGAAILFLNFHDNFFFAFAVTFPIVLVVYYAYKMNLARIQEAQEHLQELDDLYHATIASLAMAIDAKDQGNYGNVHRVRAMTMALARLKGIADEDTIKGLRAAALLHDIGKLAIPEYILNKPGRLTEAEVVKVKKHPEVGADILETIPFPYPVVPFVRHHHERWDGSGYPEGLKRTEIPLGARILSVVDTYFGLRTDRPYRPRLTRDLALNFVRQESGKAFDPEIVELLLEHIEELELEAETAGSAQLSTSEKRLRRRLTTPVNVKESEVEKTVFHDIASTHKEMQAVYEIAQNIGRSLNVQDTLVYLSTRIKRFVSYSACAIYLTGTEDERLIPHHVAGMYRDILEGVEVKIGEGVTGWVAAHNKALVNVSPASDFLNQPVLQKAFKSSLAVPLALEKSVVGVITLYSDAPNNYQEPQLRLMEAIAPHSAAAVSNAVVYQETQEDAYTDVLTGLPNVRYFNTFINEELRRAKRIGYPVSILMMDLDRFKRVNDRFGHQTGDQVLIKVSQILRAQLRKSDTCLRYGGDEFLAILPGVDKSAAGQTVERVREAVAGGQILDVEGTPVRIGISIGVASFPNDGLEANLLVAMADRDMYQSKTRSREDEQKLIDFPGRE